MKEGTYRLTRDLAALRPDKRRSRDWRARPLRAGTLMRVGKWPTLDDTDLFVIWTGAWSHMHLRLDKFPIDALEAVVETPSQWLQREHSGLSFGGDILDELVKRGTVTMAQIQELAADILDEKKVP